MRPTLTRTLFASFLALTLLVLVATLGLARWSFERGFYEYVRTLDRYRLEVVALDLVALYPGLGRDWSRLDPGTFEAILSRYAPPGPPPRPPASDGTPATLPSGPVDPPPPPRGPASVEAGDGGRDLQDGSRRPGPRTALFDMNGEQLVGDRLEFDRSDHVVVPVIFDGQPVAELQATVKRQIESPAETAFASRQARASALIGVAALALAAVVSWLLSRALLRPIKASIAGVARLSSGDYAVNASGGPGDSSGSNGRRIDELGRLAGDLERLRRTLESGRSSRRRLLADVSHELRTPLTILSGEISAMKDGMRPFDGVQLASIDQEVERLKALVEDLYELSVSDVGGLRYAFEPVDVDDVLRRAVETVRRASHDAGIELELHSDGPVEVQADRRRLEQLFANLLSNSIACTDVPGRSRVRLEAVPRGVRVIVEDSAPGADIREPERLFESLYRDDASRSRRTGGAGLGLAICRNIVEAHGGRIAASPSKLGGLRIEVALPRHQGVEA